MKCVKVENGVVVNSAIFETCPKEWIESEVGKGYLYDPETGEFAAPDQEDTTNSNEIEYFWAEATLESTDTEISKINRGSSRAVGALYEWYAYQEALCDYASVDSDGVYSTSDVSENTYTYEEVNYIVSIGDDGRPVSPLDSGVSEA